MLMAKIENALRAPPANRSSSPKMVPSWKRRWITAASTPGAGMCTPMRKMTNIPRVKRMRRRRSPTFRARVRVASTSDHLGPAAGRLNLLHRRAAEGVGAHHQAPAQLAATQYLDAVPAALDQPVLPQQVGRHFGVVVEAVEGLDVDLGQHPLEGRVGEAALGQTPLQRRLAALEPRPDGAAGPGLLAFVAAPGGLAVAGTDAAAYPAGPAPAARAGLQVMQSRHWSNPPTRTTPPPSCPAAGPRLPPCAGSAARPAWRRRCSGRWTSPGTC